MVFLAIAVCGAATSSFADSSAEPVLSSKVRQARAEKANRRAEFAFEGASIVSFSQVFVSLQLEYQPKFIQDYGILGIGASFSVADSIQTHSNLGFGGGALLRYQFKYTPHQIIVPNLGYQAEYRTYSGYTGSALNGPYLFHSPFAGVWLNVSELDKSSAHNVNKTYVIVEVRNNFVQNNAIWLSNYNAYAGIRLEF